jgi:hypothetical protein
VNSTAATEQTVLSTAASEAGETEEKAQQLAGKCEVRDEVAIRLD